MQPHTPPPKSNAASPLTRSLLLLFAAGATVVAGLLIELMLRREMLPLPEFHVYAERVDAMRWLNKQLVPGAADSAASCADEDRLCLAVRRLNQRLAKDGSPLVLKTGDATPPPKAAETATWLARNGRDAQRILETLRASERSDFDIRGNPFRLSGCLYGDGASRETAASRCTRGISLEARSFPPHSAPLQDLLADWRQPWEGAAPNVTNGIATGRDLWLTLNATVQQKAQQTADCYTAHHSECNAAWWYPPRHAKDMFEGARARSVGVLVVDVKDGGIRAMASAHTPCFAARARGEAQATECPGLPADKARPHRLGNPVGEGEMPGSSLKPQQGAALLEAGNLTPSEKARLPDILRRSDTEAIIDLYLCREQGFDRTCIARRVAALERRLALAGGNRDCGERQCQPTMDLLGISGKPGSELIRYEHGDDPESKKVERSVKAFNYPVFATRALRHARGRSLVDTVPHLSIDAMRACYRGGSKQRWRGCEGEHLVNLIAELYGQGNARASQIGLSVGWLQLAAAADGRPSAPLPHLVAAYQTAYGAQHKADESIVHGLGQSQARFLLDALEKVAGSGSAASACKAASSTGGALRCQPSASLRIAAKTGTPLFSVDHQFNDRPNMLGAWRDACDKAAQAPASPKNSLALGKCKLRPLKWFAALVAPEGKQYEYLVVVQAERNWHRDGRIDDAGDITADGNVAAEIGLALINALVTPTPPNR